ncbi:MAG: hypothetical protein H7Y15_19760 [Pseudonocardia sp.]|nr:hypothetical protein [Pseudonocardia sp.]
MRKTPAEIAAEDRRETDALIAFVTARLDETQQAAERAAAVFPSPWDVYDRGHSAKVQADHPHYRTVTTIDQDDVPESEVGRWPGEFVEHIARHDPARVLADVTAKRGILASLISQRDDGTSGESTASRAVLALARIDAAHPDFWPEWAPEVS